MLILSNRQHLAGLEGLLAAVSSLGNGGAIINGEVIRLGVVADMAGECDHLGNKCLVPAAHEVRIILLAGAVLVNDIQQVLCADVCNAQRAVRADDLGLDIAACGMGTVGEHEAHCAVLHLDSYGQ